MSRPWPHGFVARASFASSAGGGTLGSKCPKCGSYALVYSRVSPGKSDESAFYCSVCSGWFVVSGFREHLGGAAADGPRATGGPPNGTTGVSAADALAAAGTPNPDALADEDDLLAATAARRVPTPREIYAGLDEHVPIEQRPESSRCVYFF